MRKFLCILVAFVICLGTVSFTGCGKNNEITITYNGNGGVATVNGEQVSSVNKTVTLGESFVAPKFVYDGYTLVGWDKKVNDVTADTEVNAIWQKIPEKQYEVTFDLNGGTLVAGELSQTVEAGKSAQAPTVKREGYEFLQWSAIFEDVNMDIVVHALWKPLKYLVSFDANGGTFTDPSAGTIKLVDKVIEGEQIQTEVMTVEVEYGKAAVPPLVSREGFYILGYDSNGDGEIDADFGNIKANRDDKPIQVIWAEDVGEPSNHTVEFRSFLSNYGVKLETSMSKVNVEHNQNATVPTLRSTPYPYRIRAWLGDNTRVKQNRVLYALWEEVQFTMSFDLNGGKLDNNAPANKIAGITQYTTVGNTPGKISEVPVPVRDGYIFTKWEGTNAYYNNPTDVEEVLDGKGIDEYYRWTSNVVFVAEWEIDTENPIEYTITFDGGLGLTENGDGKVTKVFAVDEEIIAPEFVREGYELFSWSMALNDIKEHCEATGVYEYTVKASWRELWNKTTAVLFDTNGGNPLTNELILTQGKKIPLLITPEKELGTQETVCKFIHWYYEKNVEGVVKQIEVLPGTVWRENLKTVTFYAKWYEGVPETIVKFNIYGNMEDIETNYDYITDGDDFVNKEEVFVAVEKIPELPIPKLSEDASYVFLYWYYQGDNKEEIKVVPGEIWDVNKSEIELLPKWQHVPVIDVTPEGPFNPGN